MYSHITSEERENIAIWKAQGVSNREVARRLKRDLSTVKREVKRNRSLTSGYYVVIAAQSLADQRSLLSRKRHPLKNPLIYSYVLERLRRGWSPEQIAGRLKKESGKTIICHETIYSFIYGRENQTKRLWEYLPRKQKRRQKQTGRSSQKVRIAQRVSIRERPIVIDQRNQFGHWEGDTVEGRRSEGDGIHTEVERMSRFFLARRVDRIDSPEGINAQKIIFSQLPNTARISTTLDNGRENHLHFELWNMGTQTYFADSYASWQRGTNENSNGLLRRYLPKGTSFKYLTQEELDEITEEMNNRPRKCLGYNTSSEVFYQKLNELKGCTSN